MKWSASMEFNIVHVSRVHVYTCPHVYISLSIPISISIRIRARVHLHWRPTFTGAYYRFQCAPTPFAAFSPFPLPLRPSHPSRPFYLSRPLRPGVRGRRHWRQPLIGQRPMLLPPATALALLWGERPCRRPRFIGPPFLQRPRSYMDGLCGR